MRLDPVLVVAAAGIAGGCFAAEPRAAAAATLGVAVLLARALPLRVVVVSFVVLAAAVARALAAPSLFEAELVGARDALGAPRRCVGVGRVVRSPTERNGVLGFVARFESLDCEGRALSSVSARLYGGPPDLARGDFIEVTADLAPVEMFKNAELPDPVFPAARAGIVVSGGVHAVRVVKAGVGFAALVDKARAHVRGRIDATFTRDAAPLARALVLGENDLTESDSAAFKASGLAHLLAVSGTHLVFAVLGIVRALGFVLARVEPLAARRDVARIAAGVGFVLAPIYADFAGGSGSAWRAAWMLMFGLAARALGRVPSPSRSFAWSLAVGAASDPLVAFDISFLLSAAATSGLLALGAPLTLALLKKDAPRPLRFVVSAAIATTAASIPCAPLLATLGPRLTLAGLAANVVAAPFGEVVSLPLCLVHAVAVLSPLERGIALVASGALLTVRAVAHVSASATWLTIAVPPPSAWHFAVIVVGLAGACASRIGPAGAVSAARKVLTVAWIASTAVALTVVESAARRAGRPVGMLRVTVLDVGQGDSTLVDLPNGEIMLVDGGGMVGSPVDPGVSVLLPLLRVRRRDRVDVAVLSHPHPDHFTGLASALRETEVGELWDTGQGRAQGAGPVYGALIANLAGRRVPIRGPEALCGPARMLGGARIDVFAPCPSFDPARGANDNSFVLRLDHGGRRVLLMGDAEREEERTLSRIPDLGADLLKVGHHGSRTSTSPALLAKVRPALATISSGVRNRFGHPHPLTLETLRAAGIFAVRTDRVGSIEWTDERPQALREFGGTFRERVLERLW